jgi:hypothetical protein
MSTRLPPLMPTQHATLSNLTSFGAQPPRTQQIPLLPCFQARQIVTRGHFLVPQRSVDAGYLVVPDGPAARRPLHQDAEVHGQPPDAVRVQAPENRVVGEVSGDPLRVVSVDRRFPLVEPRRMSSFSVFRIVSFIAVSRSPRPGKPTRGHACLSHRTLTSTERFGPRMAIPRCKAIQMRGGP